jgi:hypothetical protein
MVVALPELIQPVRVAQAAVIPPWVVVRGGGVRAADARVGAVGVVGVGRLDGAGVVEEAGDAAVPVEVVVQVPVGAVFGQQGAGRVAVVEGGVSAGWSGSRKSDM